MSLDSDNTSKENNHMRRLSFSSQSSYETDDELNDMNKMYNINNYQDMGLDMDNEIEESLFGKTTKNSSIDSPIKEMQSISDKNSLNIDNLPKKKNLKNIATLSPISSSPVISMNQSGNKHSISNMNIKFSNNQSTKDITLNKSSSNSTDKSTLTHINNSISPLPLTKLFNSISNSNLSKSTSNSNSNLSKSTSNSNSNLSKSTSNSNSNLSKSTSNSNSNSNNISSKSIEKSISDIISSDWNGSEKDKILQLAKKARNLTIALEKERGLNASLNNKLKQMEVEERKIKNEFKKQNSNSDLSGLKHDKKNLKERLNQMTLKLEQERINNQKLTFEIRNAQRALIQEVGEDIPISKILDSNGGYVGRSQQIAMLKDKVNQLTRQLSNYVSINDTKGVNAKELKLDSRHRFDIKKKEIDRKITLEKALKNIEDLKNEKHNQKLKCDAIQARNKNLEKSIKDYKSKIEVLISKTETDDKLIKALKKQLSEAKIPHEKMNERNVIKNNKSLESLRDLCNEQKSKIKFQEDKINSLSNQLKSIISSSSYDNEDSLLIQKDKLCDNPNCHMIYSQFKAIYIENMKLNELKKMADNHIKELEEKLSNSIVTTKSEKDRTFILNNSDNIEKIKEKLIIAKDENNALKSIIDANIKEKTEEIKVYQDMLKQTKQNFIKDIEIIKRKFSKVNPNISSSTPFQNNNDFSMLKSPNNRINTCDIPTII
ncbi:hypothetical protein LY90DRAFT_705602 [Neocallimastix californiae]|uniref:Uncharacterized protein n=1 Tax=Neocallimastix californiae TaxID=1754190 RepID=A0A1Y2B2U6_9FUNG|nr:hypothetical protein LY90DRAFT_705602 [Neocallimastix californiae]|eukprot:ORY29056.1 hypothetical protein LY90DRAFT_705602 [Neocallimastix californiae]